MSFFFFHPARSKGIIFKKKAMLFYIPRHLIVKMQIMLRNWKEPTILCHLCVRCLRIVGIIFCPSGFGAAPTLWVLCQNWTGGWKIAPTPHMGRRLGCFSGSARTSCTYVYLIHLYLPNQRDNNKNNQRDNNKNSQSLHKCYNYDQSELVHCRAKS